MNKSQAVLKIFKKNEEEGQSRKGIVARGSQSSNIYDLKVILFPSWSIKNKIPQGNIEQLKKVINYKSWVPEITAMSGYDFVDYIAANRDKYSVSGDTLTFDDKSTVKINKGLQIYYKFVTDFMDDKLDAFLQPYKDAGKIITYNNKFLNKDN